MFFSWLDSSEVEVLATSLVSEFAQKVPSADIKHGVRGIQRRLTESSDALYERVLRFSTKQPLNWFKRARLANSLKWKLQEAGYERALVDSLVLDVVKILSLRKSEQNSSASGNSKMKG